MKKIGIKGSFIAQIINADGTVAFDPGEQNNLITDGAFEFDGFPSGGNTYLCIGSGVVTEPSITDTQLGNQIASKSISFTGKSAQHQDDGLNYQISAWVEFTGLDAEISEIGLRKTSETGTLITRSLIKNANGDPTTITVTSSQTLRLFYKLYYFFPYVIGEGITSTPHGDLHWELIFNRVNPSSIFINYMFSSVKNYSFGSNSIGAMGGVSCTGSASANLLERKRTFNVTRSPQTSDKVMSAGEQFLSLGGHTDYSVYLTQPFTIPANYDFTMSLEINWGRMP